MRVVDKLWGSSKKNPENIWWIIWSFKLAWSFETHQSPISLCWMIFIMLERYDCWMYDSINFDFPENMCYNLELFCKKRQVFGENYTKPPYNYMILTKSPCTSDAYLHWGSKIRTIWLWFLSLFLFVDNACRNWFQKLSSSPGIIVK